MNRRTDHELSVFASGFLFLEGPRWHRGRLYFSDFGSRAVFAMDESGTLEQLCSVPEQPSGIGFLPGEELIVVSMRDRRLLRLSADGLEEAADLSSFTPHPINDMIVDGTGRTYIGGFGFTPSVDDTLGPAQIYLVDRGQPARVAADGLTFSNGMVITGEGRVLVVAETFAARISAFDIRSDGTLTNRRVWADFASGQYRRRAEALAPGDVLPDGLALDAQGAIWVADAGGSGALRVAEGGEVLERVEVPGRAVYAVALGGSDGHTLFLCVAPPGGFHGSRPGEGTILSCRVQVPAPTAASN